MSRKMIDAKEAARVLRLRQEELREVLRSEGEFPEEADEVGMKVMEGREMEVRLMADRLGLAGMCGLEGIPPGDEAEETNVVELDFSTLRHDISTPWFGMN